MELQQTSLHDTASDSELLGDYEPNPKDLEIKIEVMKKISKANRKAVVYIVWYT